MRFYVYIRTSVPHNERKQRYYGKYENLSRYARHVLPARKLDHCGLIHDDGLIADRISSQTRLFGVLIGHGIRRAMGEETAEDTKELEDMDQLIEDMS